MPENRAEEIVRTAVAQALERQLASFRESVVQEVLREVGPALSVKPAQAGSSAAGLQKAVARIQAGTTQKEILRALLDNTVLYSGRAALFVVKNGTATGWQGAGFSNNDAIRDFALDMSSGIGARVLQSRTAGNGAASDFDHGFISKFGSPADGKVALLPLLLKDKVSALVYADSGAHPGTLDAAALDVLVRATSAWLEVISQRKQAQKDGTPDAEMHSAPSGNDPFAAHAPLHTGKAHHEAESVPAAAMSAAAASGGSSAGFVLSPEDAEVHHKAQRFARLLMDEIKLYNQAKVADGRKHKDIYDRLKEDIEKSRATYLKRYGNTPAAIGNYFNQELIRSLAEDDVSLLGKNFHQ
ncbi:MAG: Chromosome segregation ATPase-like protein [Acidobacteriaceae bacterium]|nr:Chromosome segregation ATPase-like protein [Acidobacteriaceae bacterium]